MNKVLTIQDMDQFDKATRSVGGEGTIPVKFEDRNEILNISRVHDEENETVVTDRNTDIVTIFTTLSSLHLEDGSLNILAITRDSKLPEDECVSGPNTDTQTSIGFYEFITSPDQLSVHDTEGKDVNGVIDLTVEEFSITCNHASRKTLLRLLGEELFEETVAKTLQNGYLPTAGSSFKGTKFNDYNKYYLGINYNLVLSTADFNKIVETLESKPQEDGTRYEVVSLSVKDAMEAFNVGGYLNHAINNLTNTIGLDDWSNYCVRGMFSGVINELKQYFTYDSISYGVANAILEAQQRIHEQDVSEMEDDTVEEIEYLEETRSP